MRYKTMQAAQEAKRQREEDWRKLHPAPNPDWWKRQGGWPELVLSDEHTPGELYWVRFTRDIDRAAQRKARLR